MTILETIEKRESRRSYLDDPIKEEHLVKLYSALQECSNSSGLKMQLITGEAGAFKGIKSVAFSGVSNYITLVGRLNDEHMYEKAGYFGESIVLLAERLGLATCWVASSYSKSRVACELAYNDELAAVIAIGYPDLEDTLFAKLVSRIIHHRHKSIDDMLETDSEPPKWVVDGVYAATLAPSSANSQPVVFYYENGRVFAEVDNKTDINDINLGIAKLHFELGCSCGHWRFGNGAKFIIR